jgi:hypothetical protein
MVGSKAAASPNNSKACAVPLTRLSCPEISRAMPESYKKRE